MIFKSIRGRLLLWVAFLLACILAGFGVTAYQLQRINRLAQIDDELARRVAALSNDARDNSPFRPPREPPQPDEDFGRGPPRRPPPERSTQPGPPGNNPRSRTIRLSAQTQALFNETDTNGFYFGFWSRDEDLLKQSINAPVALTIPKHSAPDTVYRIRTRGELREAFHFTESARLPAATSPRTSWPCGDWPCGLSSRAAPCWHWDWAAPAGSSAARCGPW